MYFKYSNCVGILNYLIFIKRLIKQNILNFFLFPFKFEIAKMFIVHVFYYYTYKNNTASSLRTDNNIVWIQMVSKCPTSIVVSARCTRWHIITQTLWILLYSVHTMIHSYNVLTILYSTICVQQCYSFFERYAIYLFDIAFFFNSSQAILRFNALCMSTSSSRQNQNVYNNILL